MVREIGRKVKRGEESERGREGDGEAVKEGKEEGGREERKLIDGKRERGRDGEREGVMEGE